LRHEFLERHHLEFVLRGHGRLQHHAIKKQKNPTWRGFVSNLSGLRAALFLLAAHMRPHGDYPAAAAAPGDCAATHVARGSSAHGEPTGRFIACAPPRLRRLAREPAVLDAR
ncbi:hypothetical protein, partial [Burkholderia mallei]|uniref:hypothetical protein n=1 Tax=Burkholderia mallei TaxID=13373 RepID=UPI001E55C4C8